MIRHSMVLFATLTAVAGCPASSPTAAPEPAAETAARADFDAALDRLTALERVADKAADMADDIEELQDLVDRFSAELCHRPEDHGATGGGISDDSNAIQAALDAAGPGGTVCLGRATYLVQQTLFLTDDHQTLQGSGPASTLLIDTGSQPGLTVQGDGTSVRRLTLRSDAPPVDPDVGPIGVVVEGASSVVVDELEIDGVALGIQLVASDRAMVSRNIVRNVQTGIELTDGGGSAEGRHSIVDNTVDGYGTWEDSGKGISVWQVEANIIARNDLRGCCATSGGAIFVTGSSWNSISLNRITTAENGIQFVPGPVGIAAHNTVIGNVLWNLHPTQGGGDGLSLQLDEPGVLTDNVFIGNIVHDADTGIGFSGEAAGEISGNIVVGNAVSASATTGIILQGADDNIVSSNISESNVHHGVVVQPYTGNPRRMSNANLIDGNALFDNGGSGVRLDDTVSSTLVSDNMVHTSGEAGLSVGQGASPDPNPSDLHVLAGNVVFSSGASGGISVGADGRALGRIALLGNHVSAEGGEDQAILFGSAVSDSIAFGNVTLANGQASIVNLGGSSNEVSQNVQGH